MGTFQPGADPLQKAASGQNRILNRLGEAFELFVERVMKNDFLFHATPYHRQNIGRKLYLRTIADCAMFQPELTSARSYPLHLGDRTKEQA